MPIASIDNSSDKTTKDTYISVNWVLTGKKANGYIYATLCAQETDHIIISATLDYILDAVNKYGYRIDNAQALFIDMNIRGYFARK